MARQVLTSVIMNHAGEFNYLHHCLYNKSRGVETRKLSAPTQNLNRRHRRKNRRKPPEDWLRTWARYLDELRSAHCDDPLIPGASTSAHGGSTGVLWDLDSNPNLEYQTYANYSPRNYRLGFQDLQSRDLRADPIETRSPKEHRIAIISEATTPDKLNILMRSSEAFPPVLDLLTSNHGGRGPNSVGFAGSPHGSKLVILGGTCPSFALFSGGVNLWGFRARD